MKDKKQNFSNSKNLLKFKNDEKIEIILTSFFGNKTYSLNWIFIRRKIIKFNNFLNYYLNFCINYLKKENKSDKKDIIFEKQIFLKENEEVINND